MQSSLRPRKFHVMTYKLNGIEWLALVLSVAVACGFLLHQWWYPSTLYDAGQYSRMARDIAEHGLFARFSASGLRTYGYPVLLSFVVSAADLIGVGFRDLLFVLQFACYLGACLLFREALTRLSPLAARIAFCGMLVNPFVLIYMPEPLTESLSVILLIVAASCWLMAHQGRGGIWPLVVGTMVSGFALMVRPANLFLAVAWLLGALVIVRRAQLPRTRALVTIACVVAALMLPMLPQLAYNVLRFGRWTPLTAQDLGGMQMVWGIEDLKYATAMPPNPEARVHYLNPFVAGTTIDPQAPARWYIDNPGRGALTLAIHTFNLTDQDLLFTYSRDLDPWYRVPVGVINHGIVAMGVLGFVLGLARVRVNGVPGAGDAWAMLILTLGANWGMHVWTAVEMRFGVALLLVFLPLAGYTGLRLAAVRKAGAVVATGIAVAAYVVFALLLSNWVRDQAPLIGDARANRAAATAGGVVE